METYKCELRQAYEKKGFVYTIFNNSAVILSDAIKLKSAPRRLCRCILRIKCKSNLQAKIIPGILLNLLNDTNLSEFLSRNAVSQPGDHGVLDA
ncbi:hypothetical protein AW40_02585 [Kosakonia radicincitans UMEnt01/12]|nr:hypothetical protein AW40_02585 [Kosakonia radicincitans UMEnt01/12]